MCRTVSNDVERVSNGCRSLCRRDYMLRACRIKRSVESRTCDVMSKVCRTSGVSNDSLCRTGVVEPCVEAVSNLRPDISHLQAAPKHTRTSRVSPYMHQDPISGSLLAQTLGSCLHVFAVGRRQCTQVQWCRIFKRKFLLSRAF